MDHRGGAQWTVNKEKRLGMRRFTISGGGGDRGVVNLVFIERGQREEKGSINNKRKEEVSAISIVDPQ